MPILFQQEPQWKRAGQNSITTVEWKARSDVIAAISKNLYAAISARGSMPILFEQEAQWKDLAKTLHITTVEWKTRINVIAA